MRSLHVMWIRCSYLLYVIFIKQKTAYEMRISDCSSDVCSSDLPSVARSCSSGSLSVRSRRRAKPFLASTIAQGRHSRPDRKSVVSGTSVSVRVALGGRRIIKKTKQNDTYRQQHSRHTKITSCMPYLLYTLRTHSYQKTT